MELEKRKYQRQSASEEISFTMSLLDFGEMRHVNGSALMLNKSKGGSCIKTTIALEPGHVLRILSDSKMRVAVIKWIKIDDSHYIAGLENEFSPSF